MHNRWKTFDNAMNCRMPDERALLWIKGQTGSYTSEQLIMAAFIDGFSSATSDITKLLLRLGNQDKETCGIVIKELNQLRSDWKNEFYAMVSILNTL